MLKILIKYILNVMPATVTMNHLNTLNNINNSYVLGGGAQGWQPCLCKKI
jgi:hypothetical protein